MKRALVGGEPRTAALAAEALGLVALVLALVLAPALAEPARASVRPVLAPAALARASVPLALALAEPALASVPLVRAHVEPALAPVALVHVEPALAHVVLAHVALAGASVPPAPELLRRVQPAQAPERPDSPPRRAFARSRGSRRRRRDCPDRSYRRSWSPVAAFKIDPQLSEFDRALRSKSTVLTPKGPPNVRRSSASTDNRDLSHSPLHATIANRSTSFEPLLAPVRLLSSFLRQAFVIYHWERFIGTFTTTFRNASSDIRVVGCFRGCEKRTKLTFRFELEARFSKYTF